MFRRRPVAGAIVTGAIAGNVAARTMERKQQQRAQQMAMQEQVAQANAQAAQAQKQAEEAQRVAASAATAGTVVTAQTVANTTPVLVAIPPGIGPGGVFTIEYLGQQYSITCPPNAIPGQQITVQLPAKAVVVSAVPQQQVNYGERSDNNFAQNAAISAAGKALLQQSLSDDFQQLILIRDHKVDEESPSMKAHNIISASKGETVSLLQGDLVNGLGGKYKDYIEVKRANGRSGKISRHVVEKIDSSAPPPPLM